MSITNIVRNYRQDAQKTWADVDLEAITIGLDLLLRTVAAGKQIFVVGNGGSASTAQHMAADLTRESRNSGSKTLAACLSDSQAVLTAVANDFDYSLVFSTQLSHRAAKGDLLIVLSVSGISLNCQVAVEEAKKLGMVVLSLTGRVGPVSDLADCAIVAGDGDYGLAEDFQVAFAHLAVRTFRRGRPHRVEATGVPVVKQ